MHNQNNVIAFDLTRAKRTVTRAISKSASEDNVISLADWRGRARARRTAAGVYFTTGVLTTCGSAA